MCDLICLFKYCHWCYALGSYIFSETVLMYNELKYNFELGSKLKYYKIMNMDDGAL